MAQRACEGVFCKFVIWHRLFAVSLFLQIRNMAQCARK